MKINEELENATTAIALFIIHDKQFEPYRWTTTWISGESTEVYPVKCGYEESNNTYYIIIQLSTSKSYWYAKVRSLLKRVRTEFPQNTIKHNIYKYDGSRPYELELYIS